MADLWTLPASTPYRFATDSGVRLEPIAGRKAEGWVPGEPVSALQANDLWGVASDWVVLLQAIAPADGTLAAQSFDIYDTAGTPALAGSWVAGSVADSVALVVGAATWEWGVNGLVGPCATAGADGGRYGYNFGDLLTLVHNYGPATGGWMSYWDAAAGGPSALVWSGGYAFLTPTGGGTPYNCSHRRPVLCPYDPAMTGPGRFPKIVTMSAVFTGATSDLVVRFLRILRSSGAVTVEATINQATPSFTFPGSGLILDPQLKDYAIEIYAAGAAATTTDGVKAIQLTADHGLLLPVM